jgi:ribosomal protein S18 acetylase RimI-like enzyme
MSSSALREVHSDDAEAVAALFVEAYGDARPMDADEIRSWLANEEIKPEFQRVLEQGGRVVAYADIWVEDDEVAVDVAAPDDPLPMLEWAEAEARHRRVPRVRVFLPAEHELADVLERRGYTLWRSSFTMEIELGELEPARIPDGLRVGSYRPEDAEAVRLALNETFSSDAFFHAVSESNFREFYLQSRGFDPAFWFLAWDGDELAGFNLAYPERVGEPGCGWIGTLGVRPAWRRRGLGEALLRVSFAALAAHGLKRAGLGVDTENPTGALGLYERAGMRAVRRYDNWICDLSLESAPSSLRR